MKKTILIVFTLLCGFIIQAQEAIPASGGEATGNLGTASISVGQLVYTTNSSLSGESKQGIQQGIELFALNNLELTALTLTAVVHPNPTKNRIVLALKDSDLNNLSYVLYDINGRRLASGKVESLNTNIPLGDYESALYILKVSQNNIELKSFKIIKN